MLQLIFYILNLVKGLIYNLLNAVLLLQHNIFNINYYNKGEFLWKS